METLCFCIVICPEQGFFCTKNSPRSTETVKMTNAPNNLKRGEKGMRKRNMLIPAVILMATLLSAGCTAGTLRILRYRQSGIGCREYARSNGDSCSGRKRGRGEYRRKCGNKSIAVRGEVYTGSGLSQGPWGYESSHHVFTHVCSGLGI